MLVRMLNSHPDLNVCHEFGPDRDPAEAEHFDGILCQYQNLPEWTWDYEFSARIHLRRMDYRRGALSQLLLAYKRFIPNTYDVPVKYVDELANERRKMDVALLDQIDIDYTLTYEDLTGGRATKYMPVGIRRQLLDVLRVTDHALQCYPRKVTKIPRNYRQCLNVA